MQASKLTASSRSPFYVRHADRYQELDDVEDDARFGVTNLRISKERGLETTPTTNVKILTQEQPDHSEHSRHPMSAHISDLDIPLSHEAQLDAPSTDTSPMTHKIHHKRHVSKDRILNHLSRPAHLNTQHEQTALDILKREAIRGQNFGRVTELLPISISTA